MLQLLIVQFSELSGEFALLRPKMCPCELFQLFSFLFLSGLGLIDLDLEEEFILLCGKFFALLLVREVLEVCVVSLL